MTREQAKREIDSLDFYLQNHTDDYGEESHTAMMMAIKALEQQPCEDCISRENTLKAIIEQLGIRNEDYLIPAEATLYKVVKNMPSVNLHPKTGQWINNQNGTFECDQCGCKHSKSRFCPDCGTKMQEVAK